MAIVVNELYGSRSQSIPANGQITAKRSFIVYDDGGATLTQEAALAAEDVPSYLDEHPGIRDCLARSAEVKGVKDSEAAHEITWTYTIGAVAQGGGSYQAASTSVKGTFVDVWRVPPGVGNPGGVDNPTRADIGGRKVDAAGDPVSYPMYQQMLTLRSPFNNPPDFSLINAMINRRNASPWQGWPQGMVLYLGADASVTSGNYWLVSHKFAADEFFHMRQVVKRDNSGKTLTENTGTEQQATTVYWVQPFPLVGNFNAIGGVDPGGGVGPIGFNYA